MSAKPASNFTIRLLVSVILGPLVLLDLWYGGWAFSVLVLFISWRAAYEWLRITIPNRAYILSLVGAVYSVIFLYSALWLREQPDGLWLTLFILLAVWATDIGAYLAGRTLGGPKLAPTISPKKTWSGLLGGMAAAYLAILPFEPIRHLAVLAIGFAVVAQIGDLLESALKRRFNVKDSGNIIPGHGGILDRIDGLMLALPLFALLVATMGHGLDLW